MSLLDDNFDIDNDILYKECIKYMLNTSNYLYPIKQSLGKEIIINYRTQLPEIKIIAPSHIPDYFLIGYDIDFDWWSSNYDILHIRLFDSNLIKINEDDVVYEDDKEKCIYTFDKIHLRGYFGKYRLCTHLIHNGGNHHNYGHLILSTTDVINKCITQKYFLYLPNTSMEHYIMYQRNKSIDFHKIEEENILN